MQAIEKDRFDSSLYDQRHSGPFDRGFNAAEEDGTQKDWGE
jgi:hypothetical protein